MRMGSAVATLRRRPSAPLTSMRSALFVGGLLALAGCMNQCDSSSNPAPPAASTRAVRPLPNVDQTEKRELLQVKRIDAATVSP